MMSSTFSVTPEYLREEAATIAESQALKPSLALVCQAVSAVVPWLTLLRFDTLARCYEASTVGALVLRSYGFQAEVVPAAALLLSDRHQTGISCGGTPDEIPRWLESPYGLVDVQRGDLPRPPHPEAAP